MRLSQQISDIYDRKPKIKTKSELAKILRLMYEECLSERGTLDEPFKINMHNHSARMRKDLLTIDSSLKMLDQMGYDYEIKIVKK